MMCREELSEIATQWDKMTFAVLDLEKFSLAEMQRLLKKTYAALNTFHKESYVPKEICQILLNADSFLYFASLMEDKEVGIDFYHYQIISSIVTALKAGFFHAEYAYPFPRLKVCDSKKNGCIFNMETDSLESLI